MSFSKKIKVKWSQVSWRHMTCHLVPSLNPHHILSSPLATSYYRGEKGVKWTFETTHLSHRAYVRDQCIYINVYQRWAMGLDQIPLSSKILEIPPPMSAVVNNIQLMCFSQSEPLNRLRDSVFGSAISIDVSFNETQSVYIYSNKG